MRPTILLSLCALSFVGSTWNKHGKKQDLRKVLDNVNEEGDIPSPAGKINDGGPKVAADIDRNSLENLLGSVEQESTIDPDSVDELSFAANNFHWHFPHGHNPHIHWPHGHIPHGHIPVPDLDAVRRALEDATRNAQNEFNRLKAEVEDNARNAYNQMKSTNDIWENRVPFTDIVSLPAQSVINQYGNVLSVLRTLANNDFPYSALSTFITGNMTCESAQNYQIPIGINFGDFPSLPTLKYESFSYCLAPSHGGSFSNISNDTMESLSNFTAQVLGVISQQTSLLEIPKTSLSKLNHAATSRQTQKAHGKHSHKAKSPKTSLSNLNHTATSKQTQKAHSKHSNEVKSKQSHQECFTNYAIVFTVEAHHSGGLTGGGELGIAVGCDGVRVRSAIVYGYGLVPKLQGVGQTAVVNMRWFSDWGYLTGFHLELKKPPTIGISGFEVAALTNLPVDRPFDFNIETSAFCTPTVEHCIDVPIAGPQCFRIDKFCFNDIPTGLSGDSLNWFLTGLKSATEYNPGKANPTNVNAGGIRLGITKFEIAVELNTGTVLPPTRHSVECVDTTVRGAQGWTNRGFHPDINAARSTCAGYTKFSVECPIPDKMHVFCLTHNQASIAPPINPLECEGVPFVPNADYSGLNGGSNGHCIGPYFETSGDIEYALGGWHRGALYPTLNPMYRCIDTRQRHALGWQRAGVYTNLYDSRAACASLGYNFMSIECPQHGSFEVWCLPDSGVDPARTLGDAECRGHAHDHELGSNVHCVGPYLRDEDGNENPLGGSWRGAVYRIN